MTERRRNRVVAVTGASGAGKDYVMARAAADNGIRVENWGTWLGQELKTHRDEMMERVEPEKIRATQFTVCRRLLQLCPLVVTCHTVRVEQGRLRYDLELESLFDPECYVYVYAPPELIESRVRVRNETEGRRVPRMSVAEIERTQEQELLLLRELAGELRTRLVVVRNTPEEEKECISIVRHEIRALMREAWGWRRQRWNE